MAVGLPSEPARMPATDGVIGIVSVTTIWQLPVVAVVLTYSNLKQASMTVDLGFEFAPIGFISIDGEIGIGWCMPWWADLNWTIQSIRWYSHIASGANNKPWKQKRKRVRRHHWNDLDRFPGYKAMPSLPTISGAGIPGIGLQVHAGRIRYNARSGYQSVIRTWQVGKHRPPWSTAALI